MPFIKEIGDLVALGELLPTIVSIVKEYYYLAILIILLLLFISYIFVKTTIIIKTWISSEDTSVLQLLGNNKLYHLFMPYLLRKSVKNEVLEVPERRKALDALPNFKSHRTISFISNLLQDVSQELSLRECAALSLANTGSSKAIKPLCEVLKDFQKPRIAEAAAQALQKFDPNDALSVLMDCLILYAGNYKGHYFVLAKLLETIDYISDKNKPVEMIEPLKEVLLNYDDTKILAKSFDIIRRINSPAEKEALKEVRESPRFLDEKFRTKNKNLIRKIDDALAESSL